MLENIPTEEDLSELAAYAIEGKALEYTGMTYADGIMAMLDWMEGNADRPDKEE